MLEAEFKISGQNAEIKELDVNCQGLDQGRIIFKKTIIKMKF